MGRHRGPKRPPAQKKPPLTHFLCLPLVTPTSKLQLEASVARFRDEMSTSDLNVNASAEKPLDDEREVTLPVIPDKAIRPIGSLHCTLGVMALSKDQLASVVELLKGIDIKAMLKDAAKIPMPEDSTNSSGPITVDLKGLVSMHAPDKTSILYSAPHDRTERLYPLCLELQKLFKNEGYLVDDNRELKLHATIVNTIYAKGRKPPPKRHPNNGSSAGQASSAGSDRSTGHGPNANAPIKIDATAILEIYKDFAWAEGVVLDRVAICEMGAKKVLDDQGKVTAEEYTEVATIALPD